MDSVRGKHSEISPTSKLKNHVKIKKRNEQTHLIPKKKKRKK